MICLLFAAFYIKLVIIKSIAIPGIYSGEFRRNSCESEFNCSWPVSHNWTPIHNYLIITRIFRRWKLIFSKWLSSYTRITQVLHENYIRITWKLFKNYLRITIITTRTRITRITRITQKIQELLENYKKYMNYNNYKSYTVILAQKSRITWIIQKLLKNYKNYFFSQELHKNYQELPRITQEL